MLILIVEINFLTYGHGRTFQDQCLGFQKRYYLLHSMKMTTHGEPLKKEFEFPTLTFFSRRFKIQNLSCWRVPTMSVR